MPAPAATAPNGISTNPGVPNLAGQRPGYLYLELKAYQSGARGDSAMNNAVKFLSDDALIKVAAYFASLDPRAGAGRSGRAGQPRSGASRQGRARRPAPAATAIPASARSPAFRAWSASTRNTWSMR